MLVIVVVASFIRPLYTLVQFALHSDLYSHILLIPFVSIYLIWLQQRRLVLDSAPWRKFALLPLFLGITIVSSYWFARNSGWTPHTGDYLALMTLAFLAFLFSAGFLLLGTATLRTVAFPSAFLVFMVPFPEFLLRWIETFLQYGSAEVASAFLKLSGMPVFRQGLEFHLPGFSMHVAPECSGIHSSLVLFITSVLAGQLLLRQCWTRTVFVLAVVPLAMLRNGFRIFTLGELCVRVNPDWINSELHHRGGPLFFAVSLIPFFFLLWWLKKQENKEGSSHGKVTKEKKV